MPIVVPKTDCVVRYARRTRTSHITTRDPMMRKLCDEVTEIIFMLVIPNLNTSALLMFENLVPTIWFR